MLISPRSLLQILRNLVEVWTTKIVSRKTVYNHIDVTLTKNGTSDYSIRVTNYGTATDNILRFSRAVFSDIISFGGLPRNTSLATIYMRNQCNDREIRYDLRLTEKCFALKETTNDEEFGSFSHWKEYLSFKLKHMVSSREVEKLVEFILKEIDFLQSITSNIKFTVHRDRKILYNNHIPLDDEYKTCQALSSALTNIIKQSLNVEFKEACLDALKVKNSHQTEAALMGKLLPLIHQNYVLSDEAEATSEIQD